MQLKVLFPLLIIFIFLLSCDRKEFRSKPSGKTVEVLENNGQYQLYRNGSPYFIKGAGAYVHLEDIKKAGGNSIRIYDTENARQVLDKAHELGLTVTVGLGVAKAITEMDYSDEKAVAAQLAKLRKEVLKYKDHPALLMWGIGNEATLHVHPLFTKPGSIITNIRTLLAINDIAEMIHEVDPNHPTTTMLQGVPPKRTTLFLSNFCKEIDLLSFNIFMPLINNVPQLIKDRGWDGPYILTEYGSLGYWHNNASTQTDWYAIYEQTSFEKAKFIQEYYQRYILSDKNKCLGSYVFYWGQKTEFTSTWFSLYTEDGRQTEVVDAMKFLWTNKWPEKRGPSIKSIRLNRHHPLENVYIKAGDKFIVTISMPDAEHRDLTLNWEILEDENNRFFNSRYNQTKPKVIVKGEMPLRKLKNFSPERRIKRNADSYHLDFTAPDVEGPYRLFLFIRNEHDKVATANAPFYVLSMH
jgi:hypothetical protein